MHLIEITSVPAVAGDRNTVGGWPILEPRQPWPVCGCGTRMVHFFQIDMPVPGGEHLLAFQCPEHNEACFGPGQRQLPHRFWDTPPPPNELAHWRFLRQRSGVPADSPDPYLQPRRLVLRQASDRWGFRVGGAPAWIQGPERYRCACGSALVFLAQLPENFGFPKRAEAAEQPDSFSGDEYCMFLGNAVYLLGCPARCDPAAVWPVNQN
jgi:hypothetical protein